MAERNRVRRHISRLLLLVAAADLAVVAGAILLAWDLRLNLDLGIWAADARPSEALSSTVGPYVAVVWIVLLFLQGAYSGRNFAVGPEEFKVILHGSLLSVGAVGLFCYLAKIDLSRGFLLLTFLLGIPMLLVERYVVRRFVHRARARGRLLRRVVAVGGPADVQELFTVLNRERYAGFQIVGACLPSGIEAESAVLPVPLLGSVVDTRRVCEESGADTVLVARGGYSSSADLRQIAWDLGDSEIDLVVVPSLTDVAGPRIHMRPVGGLPLLHVEGPQATEAGGLGKRLFDIVGASAVLLLAMPVFLVVAAAIWLEDRSPVLYRQLRIGRDGQAFDCLKFRSMYMDADSFEEELRDLVEHDGALFKHPRDPRVTRVGRFIRRYSLDELPQLLNVLRGEMSLVGPRPQQVWEVETYNDSARRRLLVRPGMTGLWQVSGRSTLSWDEAVRLDLYYVDNWSMLTDLVIMTKTVRAVLSSNGAY